MEKETIGLISVILIALSYIPYYIGIYHGTLKPHLFTWLQWTFMMGIVFAAQSVSGAGAGAWSTGVGTLLVFIIALASIKYGEKNITRSDWITFLIGLSGIPLWIITKDPFWSVIIVTLVDASGYIPTFRKSWLKPHEESASLFAIWSVTSLLTLLAVEIFIPTNYIYLMMCAVMNGALTAMLLYRRAVLGKDMAHAT